MNKEGPFCSKGETPGHPTSCGLAAGRAGGRAARSPEISRETRSPDFTCGHVHTLTKSCMSVGH